MHDMSGHSEHNPMKDCIDECTACHEVCLHAVRHCLEKGGTHADPAHISLLLDCAQMCATSADFMIRHSEQHGTTCKACADICVACATSCEGLADDEMMRACAEECRRCAASCEQMATMR